MIEKSDRYKELSDKDRNALIDNITESLMFVDENIQTIVVAHLSCENSELGERIKKGLY